MSAVLASMPAHLVASGIVPTPDDRFGGFSAIQGVALALCFVIPLIGWALLFRQLGRFVALYRLGQPDAGRTGSPGTRTWTLAKEFLGHTRMSRLKVVAVAHWFTALAFLILFTTLVNAFFQLVQPDYRLPIVGHFPPFEWLVEVFAWAGLIGIAVLIAIRQKNHPRSAAGEGGRRSRFFGSTFWQAYYVEATIFFVTICILLLRGLESAMVSRLEPETSLALHFPLTGWMSGLFSGVSLPGLATWVYVVATIKILISFAWMITISLQPTMGVAWHRFLAFPNIWFKREASGRTALGAAKPLTIGGKPFDMEAMEELEEGDTLGVGKVEDFTWKGLLDFSTCTECGRCQSQCPAWNTDKPLSPKLLMMTLRDHADAKAPFLKAAKAGATVGASGAGAGATASELSGVTEGSVIDWASMALVGETGYTADSPLSAYNPHGPDAVIDQDVLWSCTTCGACVEQCPVDIEHVDHIIDMRRYATLIESAFPSELGGLFKNLEGKGNPWGMGARARLDWAKDLPFPVKVLGQDVESATDVEWLFWVGCAGAYEDRAKKTTRAVAELLDTAGVSFAVLGDGETCTGDSARRAGNELLFQTLAAQNVETFGEFGVTKVVVTCAHCFNTIKNEYPQIGGNYEVVHHTQLLNRLVRDKKLVPVARPADVPGMSTARNAASTAETVTYHDPCYLGRHNDVYAPPRELIGALPGVELREMERTKEKSFCCGAGGARMWMEEKLGTRINTNRTEEAIGTGAERIAIGCPFCRVMISDGLTAAQAGGVAESVEVVDVAQMLLAAVRRGTADGAGVGAGAGAADGGSSSGEADGGRMPAAPAPEVTAPAAAATAAAAGAAGASAGAAVVGAAAASTRTEIDQKVTPGTATTNAEADPWDTPATSSPDASQGEPAEPDPWDEPAAAAPTAPVTAANEPDPWDEPEPSATDASPGEPTAVAPAATEPDPWDEPTTPAPAAQVAAASEPDPWDEPEPSATDASPGEPTAVAPAATEPDPWDELAAPASAAAASEPDPWDEPEPSATDASPGEPAAVAPAATEPDPWDEPVSDKDDQSVESVSASAAAEDSKPAAGFTGDAALLDEPDPWD
jgi:Fe-S oxidoreductase